MNLELVHTRLVVPSETRRVQPEPRRNPKHVITLLREIQRWLEAVKLEDDAPDLWQLARDERAWLSSSVGDFAANTPFTETERQQITAHLKTIEQYTIKTHQLNESAAANVRERLAYLSEAAGRVGRFDWKNLAASTFIQIVLTLGLDPGKAHQLLGLATQLLGSLVVGVTKMLPQ